MNYSGLVGLQFVGTNLGCTFDGMTLTSSTNEGNIQIRANFDSNDDCLVRDFYFLKKSCSSCNAGDTCDLIAQNNFAGEIPVNNSTGAVSLTLTGDVVAHESSYTCLLIVAPNESMKTNRRHRYPLVGPEGLGYRGYALSLFSAAVAYFRRST